MKFLSLLMLFVNIFVLFHSLTLGHFQALSYNLGWISSIVAWIIVYLVSKEYITLNEKKKINVLIPKIFMGGSLGLLLYARYFNDMLSYTEILGWMSSVGVWGIVLFITIGFIKIKD